MTRHGRPDLKQDPLVDKLLPDPSQASPEVVAMVGFLGKSTRQGFWRVYFTAELNDYAEVAEADLIHTQAKPSTESPMGGTVVWIRRQAQVQRIRTQSAQALSIAGGWTNTTQSRERNPLGPPESLFLIHYLNFLLNFYGIQ